MLNFSSTSSDWGWLKQDWRATGRLTIALEEEGDMKCRPQDLPQAHHSDVGICLHVCFHVQRRVCPYVSAHPIAATSEADQRQSALSGFISLHCLLSHSSLKILGRRANDLYRGFPHPFIAFSEQH
jgi:hypothetical protein